jgi:fucose permease
MQAPAGPFPLFVLSYLINGVGMSLQQAHTNTYVGSLGNRFGMGVLHASYGVGALCAPLLSTHFAVQAHWSYHYLVSAGLSILNVVSILGVFRLRQLNGWLQFYLIDDNRFV